MLIAGMASFKIEVEEDAREIWQTPRVIAVDPSQKAGQHARTHADHNAVSKPSSYRINTMTVVARTDVSADPKRNVSLRDLYHRVSRDISNGHATINRITYKDHTGVLHVFPSHALTDHDDDKDNDKDKDKPDGGGKWGRPPTKLFDNQATAVLRVNHSRINMKIFANGNLQMTGVRAHEDSRRAVEEIRGYMVAEGVDAPEVFGMRVCLMNADYKLGFYVNRQRLHDELIKERYVSSYHPAIYIAVKISYLHREDSDGRCPEPNKCQGDKRAQCCKKITVMVFYTGAIIITGAVHDQQIRRAFDWVCGFIGSRRDILEDMDDVHNRISKRRKQ